MTDPADILNAIDPDWSTEARERMVARRSFTVINLILSPDNMTAHTLARDLSYHVDIHPDNRADFSPLS